MTSVKQLRWWLFKQKQAESERLPPTQSALKQAVMRSHYQTMVWNNDIIVHPEIPSPNGYGWKPDQDGWVPVMSTELPAPQAVLHLVKCGCRTQCRSDRCSCHRASLRCADLCLCSDEEYPCENIDVNEEGDVENEN